MARKTSKASTPRPGKAGLKAGHEAFAQAYASNGGNAAAAYRKAYPRCKSAHAAETNGSLLLRNTEVAARISEILRRGAERAEITVEQVLREFRERYSDHVPPGPNTRTLNIQPLGQFRPPCACCQARSTFCPAV